MIMNKFGAIKCEYQGKIFDSKKECERYIYLQHLQKKGRISGLEWQKKFQLIPLQRENGVVVERPIYYIADFVYYDSNGMILDEAPEENEWDRYERSILRKLADEIRIGVRGGNVEMEVVKKF